VNIVLTGSIAFDYLMTFPGYFRDHILPEKLDRLSLSFLVDTLDRRRGGIAANIAYTLALLGERPQVMATVGEDFEDYRTWLEAAGVDTSGIVTIPGMFTASFFVNTDLTNAQIASFYTGAMARASDLHFADLDPAPDLAMISANDPGAMASYVAECHERDLPYMYDPSQQVVRMDPEDIRQGLNGCRGLFVNDYEFSLIEERTGLGLEQVQSGAEMIIITCGEAGADLHAAGERVHIPAVAPKSIADPTGVGDAFRGGFLKGHMHNLSLERCGQMGALAATYCLENHGPQGHKFTLAEFVSRFRENFDDRGELDGLL
jgi:adenosine kinase